MNTLKTIITFLMALALGGLELKVLIDQDWFWAMGLAFLILLMTNQLFMYFWPESLFRAINEPPSVLNRLLGLGVRLDGLFWHLVILILFVWSIPNVQAFAVLWGGTHLVGLIIYRLTVVRSAGF